MLATLVIFVEFTSEILCCVTMMLYYHASDIGARSIELLVANATFQEQSYSSPLHTAGISSLLLRSDVEAQAFILTFPSDQISLFCVHTSEPNYDWLSL